MERSTSGSRGDRGGPGWRSPPSRRPNGGRETVRRRVTTMRNECELPDLRDSPARPSVGSEVGTLRRVLVHRPGPELTLRAPPTGARPLVADVRWAERARQEHDAFTDALAETGVVVVYLQELLTQVLASSEVRADVVERCLGAARLSPTLRETACEWLEGMTAEALGSVLLGGIRWGDLPFRRGVPRPVPPGGFALPPSNHLFTHDTSTWISDGVSIHATSKETRSPESLHLDAIYRHHPLFASVEHRLWTDDPPLPAAMHGGDILVIGNGAVLVGMSERTPRAAVEALARRLFAAGAMRRVIAVPLPRLRCPARLDRMLAMVDRDAFVVEPALERAGRAYVLRPGPHGPRVEREGELLGTLAQWLGLSRLRLFGSGGDRPEPAPQRGGRSDVLALSPGVVLSYEHNVEINARLRHEGVEVITVEGIDLARCRGGPRRLSCPIERDPPPEPR